MWAISGLMVLLQGFFFEYHYVVFMIPAIYSIYLLHRLSSDPSEQTPKRLYLAVGSVAGLVVAELVGGLYFEGVATLLLLAIVLITIGGVFALMVLILLTRSALLPPSFVSKPADRSRYLHGWGGMAWLPISMGTRIGVRWQKRSRPPPIWSLGRPLAALRAGRLADSWGRENGVLLRFPKFLPVLLHPCRQVSFGAPRVSRWKILPRNLGMHPSL